MGGYSYLEIPLQSDPPSPLAAAGHLVEYGSIKTGDFRIGKGQVIEVGGAIPTGEFDGEDAVESSSIR